MILIFFRFLIFFIENIFSPHFWYKNQNFLKDDYSELHFDVYYINRAQKVRILENIVKQGFKKQGEKIKDFAKFFLANFVLLSQN